MKRLRVLLCLVGVHDFDDTPHWRMKDGWENTHALVLIYPCNRCPKWKVKGV